MDDSFKLVRDPIHGDIKLTDFFVEILDAIELQRLYNIKQLGLAHLVFPGAHHTRLEHCLGAYYLASKVADVLKLPAEERLHISCAALLHDIGHGPFSHTLESNLIKIFGVDHVDLTEKLILGQYDVVQPTEKAYIQSQRVIDILETFSVDKKQIIDIIRGRSTNKSYLTHMLNSTVDVDQLDYLIRDAYYTGVAYGMVDVDRLTQTLRIVDKTLVVDRKGVGSVENILVARGLMYSSVYFHKTVRIAELMLSKALENLENPEPFEFFRMTDSEIMNSLKEMGSFQNEIITRLKYRRLFKQAYAVSFNDLDESEQTRLREFDTVEVRRTKEQELEDAFGIPPGHVIVDVPHQELLRTEPRLNKTDIGIYDNGTIRSLDEFTPVAGAIRSRVAPDWALMVITDERYRDVVADRAEKLLFS
jgi:HD superfamily phosphohydrolase